MSLNKMILLIILLFTSINNAKTIIAKGYGSDFETALKNAKINAINMEVGEYIKVENQLQGDDLETKTLGYTTGVIEDYRIEEKGDGFVVISAKVKDRKNNAIDKVDPEQIKQLGENVVNKNEVARDIDDLNKAYTITQKAISVTAGTTFAGYVVYHYDVDLKIETNKNWFKDYETLGKPALLVQNCQRISLIVENVMENYSQKPKKIEIKSQKAHQFMGYSFEKSFKRNVNIVFSSSRSDISDLSFRFECK